MASRVRMLAMACLVAAVVLVAPAVAQDNCSQPLLILYETACDTYLIDSVLPPPTSCCTQFANIAQSDPQAMCALVSGNFGSICNEPIDKARAIALPQFCNVKNPCNSTDGGYTPCTGAPPTPTTPSIGVPTSSGTGGGSPPLPSGSASVRGVMSMALAFIVVAVYVISAI